MINFKVIQDALPDIAFVGVLVKLVYDFFNSRSLKEKDAKNQRIIEDLKARLGSKLFVSNLQYQKEFDIYLELFDKLSETVRLSLELAPIYERGLPDNPSDIKKMYEHRHSDFAIARNNLMDTKRKYAPFYQSEVSRLISELIKLCDKQDDLMVKYKISIIEANPALPPEDHKFMFLNFPKNVIDIESQIENLVREYLNNLKIIN